MIRPARVGSRAISANDVIPTWIGMTKATHAIIQAAYQALEKKCEQSKEIDELEADYKDLKKQTESGKEIIITELDRLKDFNGTKK